MSLTTHHTNWLQGSYRNDLHFLFKVVENNPLRLNPGDPALLTPHLDSSNRLAIGYGYDLAVNKLQAKTDLEAIGVSVSQAAENIINGLTGPTTIAVRNQLSALLTLPNEAAATLLLDVAMAPRETKFDDFLRSTGILLPESHERAVLFSMWYQGQGKFFGTATHPSQMTQALIEGNRAEAWYEIRYGSNGDHLPGIAMHRFAGSELFGLYDDESAVTVAQAEQTFRMLEMHRSKIFEYEQNYRAQTAIANSVYGLSGSDAVTSISAALDPAKSALLADLRTQNPDLTAVLQDSTFLSTDIYLDPGRSDTRNALDPNHSATLDATLYKTGAAHSRPNLLIGEGGNDQLTGDQGNDVLLGGTGNDRLTGGPGNDTLVGGDGVDIYVINDDGGHDHIIDDGANVILWNKETLSGEFTQNGNSTVFIYTDQAGHAQTLTFNSPATLTLDGNTSITFDNQTSPDSFADHDFGFYLTKPYTLTGAGFSKIGDTLPEGNQDQIRGTVDSDNLTGYSGRDVLLGYGGDDQLSADQPVNWQALQGNYLGFGGDTTTSDFGDWLAGGDGNDQLAGSAEADGLQGGAGDDLILGGAGHDFIYSDGTYVPISGRFVNGVFKAIYPESSLYDPVSDSSNTSLLYSNPSNDPDLHQGNLWSYTGVVEDIDAGQSGATLQYLDSAGTYNLPQGGNDRIYAGSGADRVYAGGGDDLLYGENSGDFLDGQGGNDMVYGGTGNDALCGDLNEPDTSKHGDDFLDAGSGERSYLRGNGGSDILLGGTGTDLIEGDEVRAGHSADYHGEDYIDGKGGSDTIYGEGQDDMILGGDGNDIIRGDSSSAQIALAYQGDDAIDGGAGDDQLVGDGGSDVVHGGEGNDVLNGDNLDVAVAAQGNDALYGDAGADSLYGMTGADVLDGGADDDLLQSAEGNDGLFGGTGNDLLFGETGDDYLSGGEGADQLQGNEDDDVLNGDEGADLLFGQTGQDQLFGGDDNDQLQGNEGQDTLYGEAGDDILSGGDGNDSLQGDDGNDWLMGRLDDDTLHGDEGADVLFGNGGDDALFGGEDNDELQGNEGFDLLHGEAGDDFLLGQAGSDTLLGNNGNDWLEGGIDNDSVMGDVGEDVLFGDAGDDAVFGDDGSDVVTGGDGNDQLFGDVGNDRLSGSDGDDTLEGGDGVDYFAGGAGNDLLNGGAGIDVYVAQLGGGVDTIVDTPESQVLSLEQSFIAFGGGFVGAGTSTSGIQSSATPGPVLVQRAVGNILQLEAGIDLSTISLGLGSLLIRFGNGGDAVHIEGFDPDHPYDNPVIDHLEFADGTILSFEQLLALGFDLRGTPNADTLTGTAVDDRLLALGSDDVVYGKDGSDTLDGGAGADSLYGGSGDDVYRVDAVGDVVSEDADAGTDRVESSITHTLLSDLENLTLTGALAIDGTGNALDNTLIGNAAANGLYGLAGNDVLSGNGGADTLDGGAGADTMTGAAGDDVYVVDDAGDSLGEFAAQGLDEVQSAIAFMLPAYVENLTLTGSKSIDGIGNALDNTIVGNTADNLLSGGGGADTLAGGAGDDVYLLDGADDVVIENADAGSDTVQSPISYTLGADLENLTLSGIDSIEGVGNELANVITGNAANNRIDGMGGADLMIGGGGGDYYVVDDVGDRVVEEEDDAGNDAWDWGGFSDVPESWDWVESSVSYSLAIGIEQLTLTGTISIDGIGNASANLIIGNVGDNRLTGLGGGDWLAGWDGSDWLAGGDGNDWLEDGLGEDTLYGSLGDDHYLLRDADNSITEAADAGHDTVWTITSHTLGANIEDLYLYGYEDEGIGNDLDNLLVGHESSNQLQGLAGNDTLDGGWDEDVLEGGSGNDSYLVDSAFDVVIENADAGIDTLQVSEEYYSYPSNWVVLPDQVENLQLLGDFALYGDVSALKGRGNELDNGIDGNDGRNHLSGLEGKDVIDGRAGSDWLEGGDDDDSLYGGSDAIYTDWNVEDDVVDYESFNYQRLATNNDHIEGQDGDDSVDGGAGDDALSGGDGNDVIYGGDDGLSIADPESETDFFLSNNDWLEGGDGADSLDGGSGDDELSGGDGEDYLFGGADGSLNLGNDDYLDGGAGIDTLVGGVGHDVYVVDGTLRGVIPQVFSECHVGSGDDDPGPRLVTDSADLVIENPDEGYDVVYSSVSLTLPDNVEDLWLIWFDDADDFDAVGNADANGIYGNAGNNRLDGGQGADFMEGWTGDDTYFVDTSGDSVVEQADEGIDTVRVTIDDYTLGDNLENLDLVGTAVTGYGNELDNLIRGNAMDNAIEGGAGNDLITGADGNDTLWGGSGDDRYVFAGGFGQDVAIDAGGGNDAVRMNDHLTVSDITLARRGDDVVLGLKHSADQMLLKDWFIPEHRIESMMFCDGTTVAASAIEHAVNNQAPLAADDGAALHEETLLTTAGNVLNNDSDPDVADHLSLAYPGTYVGAYGTLTLAGDGAYHYALNNAAPAVQSLAEGQSLTESFSYSAQDDEPFNPLTGTALLTLTITGSNDVPLVVNDVDAVQEDGTLAIEGNVLVNDSDVDAGTVLSVAAAGDVIGSYGTLSLAQDGAYHYVLDNTAPATQALRGDETVTELFDYAAGDGLSMTPGSLTINVTGENDAPSAVDDGAALAEDATSAVTGNLLTNDSDSDRNTVLRISHPGWLTGVYGALSLTEDGGYAYHLNNASTTVQALAAGQTVTERFAYTVADDDALNPLTAGAALDVTVQGVNDAPTVAHPLADQNGQGCAPFSWAIPGNTFADVDQGDALTLTVHSANGAPLPAWLTFDDATGVLSGKPDMSDSGVFPIEVTATDGGGLSVTDLLIVTIAAEPHEHFVTGTPQADVLNGSDCDDHIEGKAGNDRLAGKGGNDTLDGGSGIDTLLGGTGNDVYYVDGSCAGKGNEGVGNGEDAPPPGHDDNHNDYPGTAPGHPGSRGGSDGKKSAGNSSQYDGSSGEGDHDHQHDASGDSEHGGKDCTGTTDSVLEAAGAGYDLVYAAVSYTLPDHVEALRLLGTSDLAGTGNAADNLLWGQAGDNRLQGGAGIDWLQGGAGDDGLSDSDGRSLFDGGAGNDQLRNGGSGALLSGGQGNDSLNSGHGRNLITFNRGDDQDTLRFTDGQNDTLSLGGGIRYADLTFRKSGNDLRLDLGQGDRLLLEDWYAKASAQGVLNLQVISEAMPGYDQASTHPLLDDRVEVFDFAGLVKAFDAARAASPRLSSWTPAENVLARLHLGGSDGAAWGGDPAYRYGMNGNLDGLSVADELTLIGAPGFGQQMQTLQPL